MPSLSLALVTSHYFEVFAPSSAIMLVMLVIIAIGLVRLAGKAKVNHWLN